MKETFKSLGKAQAIKKLYENSGFSPAINPFCECSDGYSTTSSRLLLEGMDFDLTFFPLAHLGYKAVLEVTGDLFSTLSVPRTLKITVGLSSKLDFCECKQLFAGVFNAAKDFEYHDVALDIVPSLTGLSIAVAASGLCDKKTAASRPVAKSMDLICISNNAGAAFLGEQILRKAASLPEKERQKKLEQYKQLVGAYLKPELSPFTLKALKESDIIPSFAWFCKESLRETIASLCASSGLGAKIYVDKLPFASGSIDAAKELGVDPLQAALRGGDDCCMLFTIPIGSHERFRHDFQSWDVIGHLARPEVGAVVVSPDGLEHQL